MNLQIAVPAASVTAICLVFGISRAAYYAAGKRVERAARPKQPTPAGLPSVEHPKERIRALTDAVGYRYFYDSAQHQYAHPAAITILTPNGRIARYLYGLEFNPSDIRLGLLEASEGRSISSTEHFLLYCYAYDPSIKSYSLMARRVMMAGGVLIILALAAFLGTLWRRELKRARSGAVEARRFSPEASQVGT